MMLFNNWQFIWDQFNFTIEDGKTTNAFFLSFMVMSTYVIINIIMAFIIDVYTSIEDAEQEEKAERKEIEELGREAIAAQVEMKRKLAEEHPMKVLGSLGGKLKNQIKQAEQHTNNLLKIGGKKTTTSKE